MSYQLEFLERRTDCYHPPHRLGYQSRRLVNVRYNHPDEIIEVIDIRSGGLLAESWIP